MVHEKDRELAQALKNNQKAEERIENITAANGALTRENDRLRQELSRLVRGLSVADDYIKEIVRLYERCPSERAYSRALTVSGEMLMVVQHVPVSLEDIHQSIQSSLTSKALERCQPALSKLDIWGKWVNLLLTRIDQATSVLAQNQSILSQGNDEEDLC